MDNILYKSALKNKKNELITSLNNLASVVNKKITENLYIFFNFPNAE